MRTLVLFVSLILPLRIQAADVCSLYRGYAEVDQIIQARVFNSSYSFRIADRLGSEELSKLLGHYVTHTTESQFQNGLPNPTNTVLWYIGLSKLAQELSAICAPRPPQELVRSLNPIFLHAANAMCAWPAQASKTAQERLWLAVMGYEAPRAELEAWRGFFNQGEEAQAFERTPATEMLAKHLALIFLNPHFLLRK
ncbi:MAG TPA: hypothetical protein VFV50_13595 [Bdellovibrionales bacterium]|nr:hypothetical protein [Bdellovibrionales bacterium]